MLFAVCVSSSCTVIKRFAVFENLGLCIRFLRKIFEEFSPLSRRSVYFSASRLSLNILLTIAGVLVAFFILTIDSCSACALACGVCTVLCVCLLQVVKELVSVVVPDRKCCPSLENDGVASRK
jgi:hypothetical protein